MASCRIEVVHGIGYVCLFVDCGGDVLPMVLIFGQVKMIVLSNLFILVYLAYAWSWHLPKDSNAKRLVNLVSPVVLWLGLWHSWKMFAPSPDMNNRRLVLELIHANRRKVIVEEVKLSELSRWKAFLNCRERKYQHNLAGNEFQSHWEALCRYAAKNYSSLDSPVVRVNLFVARQRIPAPGIFEQNSFVQTPLLKWKADEV